MKKAGQAERASRARELATLLLIAAGVVVAPGAACAQDELEEAATGTLRGSVLLDEDLSPIPDVRVELLDLDRAASTDSAGQFDFADVPVGEHQLIVHYLNMISEPGEAATILIRDGQTANVEITLLLNVVPVPELVVQVEAIDFFGKMAGFDRRRESSSGTFITREDIERRQPQRLSQMFYSVPGVRVGGSAMGETHTNLYSSRSRYSCPMLYYLDGIRQPPTSAFAIDVLPPQDIEGIEVYVGPAGTPAIFRYRGAHCGVVAIWTRDPTRR